MLFEIVLNGLLLGGLYTLMGTGFSLQWGISGIINLSYGGMMVLGAYISYQFFTVLSVQPIVSAIPAAIIRSISGSVSSCFPLKGSTKPIAKPS